MFVFLLRFKIILLIFLFNVLLFSFSLSAQQPKQSNDLRTLCDTFFKKHEIRSGIPPYLLKAISLKETGRWDNNKKESFAWPWTVTSGKWSHYFKSKESAIRAVKRLQLRNIKNIDVGCMQINLKYHPKAFNSLEQAFDPNSNISYAALFLTKLHKQKKSWHRSIENYHSANPKYNNKYRKKVTEIWKSVRSKEALRKRIAVRKAYQERKARNRSSLKNFKNG